MKHSNGHSLPETREENPLLGVYTKNAEVINNFRGNNQ